jgi:hypothetical protein
VIEWDIMEMMAIRAAATSGGKERVETELVRASVRERRELM